MIIACKPDWYGRKLFQFFSDRLRCWETRVVPGQKGLETDSAEPFPSTTTQTHAARWQRLKRTPWSYLAKSTENTKCSEKNCALIEIIMNSADKKKPKRRKFVQNINEFLTFLLKSLQDVSKIDVASI